MRALLLLLGLSGGVWIDVPFVRQDKDGCGSAVIWMVMEYWRAENVPTVTHIQRELYSPEAGGIHALDMERYFRSNQFQTLVFNAEWADLEKHLAEGRPLIVCLERNTRGVPLHYVVVAGVDSARQLIWLNDPASRKLLAMSREEFETSWMDNWTLLALPAQPRPELASPPAVAAPAAYGPEMDQATAAFREQRYSDARRHVRSILRVQPTDPFANDVMATLYYLDDNLDAALMYWNRAGKPAVKDIRVEPALSLNPVLLERSLAFSRASVLNASEYRETKAMLESAGVFSTYELNLDPAGGGQFDVVLRAREKGGFGLSWLRGLPYQTVHPEFFNLGGRAVNVRSLLRWDDDRRRIWLGLSAPFAKNPKWKYSIEFDARSEEWEDPAGPVSFRRREMKGGLQSIVNDKWKWMSGAAVSERGSYALKYFAGVERNLVRAPGKRLVMDSSVQAEAGRTFGTAAARFTKIDGAIRTHWVPGPSGRVWDVQSIVRAGRVWGTPPFDELFVVGMDRDHGLWLRGHSATRERSYALVSGEVQRQIYQGSFWSVSAGPFLDSARIAQDPRQLWSTGLNVRLAVTGGFTFDLSYGRELRSGETTFFTNTGR